MDNIDSKEIKIRRLNGKLRFAIWCIAILVFLGSVAGGVYWRRTILAEQRMDENRDTAVDIIVKAMDVSEARALERYNNIMKKLDALHPSSPKVKEPESLDTARFRQQLIKEEK